MENSRTNDLQRQNLQKSQKLSTLSSKINTGNRTLKLTERAILEAKRRQVAFKQDRLIDDLRYRSTERIINGNKKKVIKKKIFSFPSTKPAKKTTNLLSPIKVSKRLEALLDKELSSLTSFKELVSMEHLISPVKKAGESFIDILVEDQQEIDYGEWFIRTSPSSSSDDIKRVPPLLLVRKKPDADNLTDKDFLEISAEIESFISKKRRISHDRNVIDFQPKRPKLL